jgi:hypothetical protein
MPLTDAFDNTAPQAMTLPTQVGGAFDNTGASPNVGDPPLQVSINTVARTNQNIGITLAGLTIAGKLLVATNVILLMGQTDPTQNGIWLVNAGVPTRHASLDTDIEANSGAANPFGLICYVIDAASTEYSKFFVLATRPPITLGTTPIVFADKSALAKTF